MVTIEEKLQLEVVRLLNRWAEGYETALMEQLVSWMNTYLTSSYKITHDKNKIKWFLEKKKK